MEVSTVTEAISDPATSRTIATVLFMVRDTEVQRVTCLDTSRTKDHWP